MAQYDPQHQYGGYPQYPSAPDPYNPQNPPSYAAAPAYSTPNSADPYNNNGASYGSSAVQPDPYAQPGYGNPPQGYGNSTSGYTTNAPGTAPEYAAAPDYAAYGAQYAAAPASAPPPSSLHYAPSIGYDASYDQYQHQQQPYSQPQGGYQAQGGYYDPEPQKSAPYGGSAYRDPYEDQRYVSGAGHENAGYDQGSYAHDSYSRDDELLAKVYEDQKYVRTKAASKSRVSPGKDTEERIESAPGGVERFKVTFVPWDGAEPEFDRVVQVGLDGISILDLSSKKTLKTYPLDTITRWALKDPSVFTFWHEEVVDTEEQTVRIMASEKANRSVLDMLTTCCYQLCELRNLQPDFGSGGAGEDTKNVLASQRKPEADGSTGSADGQDDKDVEFWIGAEHEGWLMKQGDHIKTWRRRWFVLKEGRMFWFKEHRLSAKSVSRGIIRLREIMEIKQVDKAKGYAEYTFELVVKGAKGAASQFFTADTEAEMVGWFSKIESQCQEIGVMPGAKKTTRSNVGGGASHAELAEQLASQLRISRG